MSSANQSKAKGLSKHAKTKNHPSSNEKPAIDSEKPKEKTFLGKKSKGPSQGVFVGKKVKENQQTASNLKSNGQKENVGSSKLSKKQKKKQEFLKNANAEEKPLADKVKSEEEFEDEDESVELADIFGEEIQRFDQEQMTKSQLKDFEKKTNDFKFRLIDLLEILLKKRKFTVKGEVLKKMSVFIVNHQENPAVREKALGILMSLLPKAMDDEKETDMISSLYENVLKSMASPKTTGGMKSSFQGIISRLNDYPIPQKTKRTLAARIYFSFNIKLICI